MSMLIRINADYLHCGRDFRRNRRVGRFHELARLLQITQERELLICGTALLSRSCRTLPCCTRSSTRWFAYPTEIVIVCGAGCAGCRLLLLLSAAGSSFARASSFSRATSFWHLQERQIVTLIVKLSKLVGEFKYINAKPDLALSLAMRKLVLRSSA